MKDRFLKLREEILGLRYKNLNPMQKRAVLKTRGPILILAGAGSGKTTVLVNRINHLLSYGKIEDLQDNVEVCEEKLEMMESYLENGKFCVDSMDDKIKGVFESKGVHPASILAITFTNKAAKEMKERVQLALQRPVDDMWISTFHSACVRILRRDISKLDFANSFVIYDRADQMSLIKTCIKELNMNEKLFEPSKMLNIISDAKDKLINPEEFARIHENDFRMSKISTIYKLYQEKLKGNSALDFDDIIFKTVELFENYPDVLKYYQNKFKYIMVDEYQDTNKAQYKLVSMLSQKHKNLCVVGDDDQSIYGWRGADITNILDFEKEFKNAQVIKLEQNYRSTQNILDCANTVIKNNTGRKNKNLWTENKGGEKIFVYRSSDEKEEGDFIASKIFNDVKNSEKEYKDFGILYRTNAQSRALEDALMKQSIPYRLFGGTKFYERKEVKDLIAYLRVVQNPLDDVSLKRIINVPKRGIGGKTIETVEKIAVERGESIYSILLEIDEIKELSTRARSKISTFVSMMSSFMAMKEIYGVTQLAEKILENTGYMEELKVAGDEESQTRMENLKEFSSVALEFENTSEEKNLETFLATISLSTDIDSMDENEDYVSLMTLHSAKGLEFPTVFLAGLEESIFPISRAMFDDIQLEEERRLCYVGITRAKQTLYITYAGKRTLYGKTNFSNKSRFLDEIPKEYIESLNDERSLKRMALKERYVKNSGLGLDYSVANEYKRENKAKEETYMGNKGIDVGTKIKHPKFGTGTVVSKTGSNVSIAFENKGVKNINIDYVKLDVI